MVARQFPSLIVGVRALSGPRNEVIMIKVIEIPEKGRGVIACNHINAGQVIAEDPIFEIPNDYNYPPEIDNMRMSWNETHDVIALGITNLLNHSPNSNVTIFDDFKNRTKSVIAKRDIEEGEELTINYECDLWFDVV